jgi:uncharacterized spore protein YtfJ
VQTQANAKLVYGEPVERGGTTIIPVARVQWGFGGGGIGHGITERGGGGGGVRANPAGFIEVREGRTEFRPIDDASTTMKLAAAAAAGLVAGLLLTKLARR